LPQADRGTYRIGISNPKDLGESDLCGIEHGHSNFPIIREWTHKQGIDIGA
jgi:hypothetical protein